MKLSLMTYGLGQHLGRKGPVQHPAGGRNSRASSGSWIRNSPQGSRVFIGARQDGARPRTTVVPPASPSWVLPPATATTSPIPPSCRAKSRPRSSASTSPPTWEPPNPRLWQQLPERRSPGSDDHTSRPRRRAVQVRPEEGQHLPGSVPMVLAVMIPKPTA